MKDQEKAQFSRKATNNHGTVRVNIPKEIANHLDLQPGDTISFQTEYSEQYEEYASFWNQTKQEEQ